MAKVGAAVAVGTLSMMDDTIETHADYVSSWIKVLKSDRDPIFKAASQATKAADFILAGDRFTDAMYSGLRGKR